jgi:hypothetical protein
MEPLLLWFAARRHREIVGVAALFLVLALAATWPLASAPGTHSVSDRANNDVFLNQYLIFWGAHAMVEEPTRLYHTNMFYPSRYAFAYADMLLTDSLLLAPVIWAFYDPTLAYNVLLWMAVVIGGTGMYVLARRLALSRPAALVAGVMFVANPTHFVRYRQPQFFNDGFLPWFLVALLVWLASCGLGRTGDAAPHTSTRRSLLLAAGAAVLFCLHTQTGSHNAIFGLLVGGGLVAYYTVPLLGRPRDSAQLKRTAGGLAVMALIGVVVLAPLFYPYFAVGEYLAGERITEASLIGSSATLIELLTTTSHFYSWLDTRFGWPSAYFTAVPGRGSDLFPGLILPLLACLACVPAGALRRDRFGRNAAIGATDLVLLLATIGALATWGLGWRRLGSGFAPLPTIWYWTVPALLALVTRRVGFAAAPFAPLAAARHVWQNRDLRFWVLVVGLCFLAALGPAVGLYALIRHLPGANLIRVPSRFVLPMVMAMSVMAAYGANRLLRDAGRAGAVVLLALLTLFAVESSFAPLPTAPNPYPPDPAALWLGEQPGDFAVLEIPIGGIRTHATRQMVQSVHHWKKLLVGYSGSAPPGYEERMARISAGFPANATLDALRRLDVRYILVLEERVDAATRAAVEGSARLRLVQTFDTTSIWELLDGN